MSRVRFGMHRFVPKRSFGNAKNFMWVLDVNPVL